MPLQNSSNKVKEASVAIQWVNLIFRVTKICKYTNMKKHKVFRVLAYS